MLPSSSVRVMQRWRWEQPISRPCRSRVWPFAKPEGLRKTEIPPVSVQRRIRSLGMSLTSRHSWSANQTGPSSQPRPFGEFYQRCVGQHEPGKARGFPDLEIVHGKSSENGRVDGPEERAIARSSAPLAPRRWCPRRWPLLPARAVQFWSSPSENSPAPCSMRVPSIASIHHRPDSTTIHCGAGFSCHSPTQPTGWTVNTTVASERACALFHCADAPPICFT